MIVFDIMSILLIVEFFLIIFSSTFLYLFMRDVDLLGFWYQIMLDS